MTTTPEREKFEAWFSQRYPDTEDRQHEFRWSSPVELMFAAWNAARQGALGDTPLKMALEAVSANRNRAEVAEAALNTATRDAERLDWIIDNCTTSGGGNGFDLRVWIPHDSECVRGAIDAARQSAPESCKKVDDCTESLCMQANRCKHTLPPQPQRLCVEQSEDRRDAWIPVSERLPEEGDWIVGIVITEHSYGSWIEQWESGEPVGHMTHWLPAPSTAIAAMRA